MSTTARRVKAAPSTPRRTQADRRSETRARLIEAAKQVLGARGFAGLRVAEVSRIAEVSLGAQTHHFPTKDSLVLAAVEALYRETADETVRRTKALGAARDAVAAMIEDFEEFFLGPYFLLVGEVLSVSAQQGEFRDALLATVKEHRFRAEKAWIGIFVDRGVTLQQAQDAVWLCHTVVRGVGARMPLDDPPALQRRGMANLHAILTERLSAPRNSARAR